MMKLQVLRKMQYKDTFIYIMHWDNVFQYLFAWKGDIYQQHIFMSYSWFNWFLYKIGRTSTLYTQAELEEGEKIVLNGAIDSIDKLILENNG